MSASLIGRLGSSAFRLSTATVSMSLTGSCFWELKLGATIVPPNHKLLRPQLGPLT
jgi:hypothetical protein